MDTQRRALVVRSLASAATAAGLVFASWSTPANAATKGDYHGIDVASLRSDASVVSGPLNPMRVNTDFFSPRDTKEKEGDKQKQKTKSPTKGTGSKSKANGSATGTNSASKQKSKDGSITKGTGSKNTASKNGVSAGDQTNNNNATAATAPTADSVTKGTGSKNTASKNGVEAATESNKSPNTTAATNIAPVASTAAAKHAPVTEGAVAGVQTPPLTNGAQNLPIVVGQQANGVTEGVQSLPSTSTAEAANLAGAGLALLASGGSVLVIKRRRK